MLTQRAVSGLSPFDNALRTDLIANRCVLELAGGERITLPVARWHAAADAADELLLGRCTGPTLDVGCGPGRLTVAIGARGIPVLGVDVSPVAVRLTRRRGGPALRRDVFDRIPAAGRWHHVLLADGNIGIGGDPLTLLRRVGELLAVDGTALVEVAAPGTGLLCAPARLAGPEPEAAWFPWAMLDAEAIAEPAAEAGFAVAWHGARSGRWFVELARTAQ